MTTRSDRRRAELAVIEQAGAVIVAWEEYGMAPMTTGWPNALGVQLNRLQVAQHNLLDMGLVDTTRARANKGLPLTSKTAAAWMNGARAKALSARCFRWIYKQGNLGATTDEVIRVLGATHQSVSGRISELAANGWIVDSSYRRPTSTGSDAIVWIASYAAKSAVTDGVLDGY